MRRLCLVGALAATLATSLGGCGPAGAPPTLDPLSDQVAFVGQEFTLELRASDPDLDKVYFSFSSNVPDLGARAEIRPYGDGSSAVFRWTPRAQDQGSWSFDFAVTDGHYKTVETITIQVMTTVGESGAPIFREPLGTGTTLDLSVKSCITVPILVEDSDSNQVTITEEAPLIEGAELEQTGPFTGTWQWCPTAEQIAAQDRWALTLAADDDDELSPKTVKNYLIVLRKTPKPDCPGAPPAITHAPMDANTLVGLTIDAYIEDPEGLKSAPLFYYTTTPPSNPPDVGAMTQVSMLLIDGDMRYGTWAADVPNPVVGMPSGTTRTIYYVIVAQDNDDLMGDCDHLTQAPATGTYSMTVTNPGGSGGLGLCASCTADVQCGGPGDNCVYMSGTYHCFKGCASDSECPSGYYCSITMLTSIDGASARQCIPTDYTCEASPAPPTTCTDDSYEENDSRTVASTKPALAPGTYSLVSCPDGSFADDEDWFKITLTNSSQVNVSLSGGSATDLDLALVDSSGATIVKSESYTSSESVSTCLTAGTYYIRVYAWGTGKNDYTLTWSKTSMECGGGGTCVDDSLEPDDNYMAATRVDYDVPYTTTGRQICSWDDDWYRVYMYAGETIHVTLKFTQLYAYQDLDLHLYKGTTDLTPCSESSPGTCSAANGQSADSNENLVKAISESGWYYVVVHGWNGSENTYDLCIGLSSTHCPALP